MELSIIATLASVLGLFASIFALARSWFTARHGRAANEHGQVFIEIASAHGKKVARKLTVTDEKGVIELLDAIKEARRDQQQAENIL